MLYGTLSIFYSACYNKRGNEEGQMRIDYLYAKFLALTLYWRQLNDIMLVCNVDVETAKKIAELPGFPEVDAMELQRLAPSIRLKGKK